MSLEEANALLVSCYQTPRPTPASVYYRHCMLPQPKACSLPRSLTGWAEGGHLGGLTRLASRGGPAKGWATPLASPGFTGEAGHGGGLGARSGMGPCRSPTPGPSSSPPGSCSPGPPACPQGEPHLLHFQLFQSGQFHYPRHDGGSRDPDQVSSAEPPVSFNSPLGLPGCPVPSAHASPALRRRDARRPREETRGRHFRKSSTFAGAGLRLSSAHTSWLS